MHADTDHARQAVMLQIQLIERLESADKTFAGDLEVAKAYTRLAMVEEAGGRPDEEQARTGPGHGTLRPGSLSQ